SMDTFHQAQVLASAWANETARSIEDVSSLTERYGLEAEEILNKYDDRYNYWQLEAAQAIDSTMCMHMRDFYARRVHLFLADRNHGVKYIDDVGRVFQEKMGWNDSRLKDEKHMLTEYMAHEVEWKKHF
ncbi:MAG: glycerol-3-phosphate dehydrogenase/oxidase, partial [Bdellovibrio sp.]|nr:glycerol-3-phosphate dehydrogenase/oxidase [Bdellovibrio sp.]